MQSLGLLPPSQEVVKVEEFHLQAKNNKVDVGGTFRYSKSFVAEWIWRIVMLLVLGWNGRTLDGMQERIADKIVEKIVSRIPSAARPQNPVIGSEELPDDSQQPRARRTRARRPAAPRAPGAPPGAPAVSTPAAAPGKTQGALRGVLSTGSFARVAAADADRLERSK